MAMSCACTTDASGNKVIASCGAHGVREKHEYQTGRADEKQEWDRVILQLKMNPSTVTVHDVVAQIRLLQKVAGVIV